MNSSSLLALLAGLLLVVPGTAQTLITRWDFNSAHATTAETNSPAPSTGLGTASLLGPITASFAGGAPGDPGGKAWNTAKYPAQGTASGTAGVRFAVSTAGFEQVQLQFQHRGSARASRQAVVRVAVNGVDFVEVLRYETVGADLWTNIVVDLTALAAAADNASFAFEIVSQFGPRTNQYVATGPDTTYATSGTWRFDVVSVTGEVNEPAPSVPRIVVAPSSRTNAAGATVILGVGATGAAPLAYQWQFNEVDLPGENNPSLVLPNVSSAVAGRYRVVVSNAFGRVASEEAILTISEPPPAFLGVDIQFLRALVAPPDYALLGTSQMYAIEGVVTTHANLASPPDLLFYVQDATAGLAVSWRNAPAERLPPAGTRVRVIGPLAQSNGLLQLVPGATNAVHSVTILATEGPLPSPVRFNFDRVSDLAWLEAHEGRLITVENVVLDTSTPAFANRGANLTLTSTTGAKFVLRVDGDSAAARVDLAGQPKPVGPFSVTGVLAQLDSTAPFTGSHHVLPTRYADLVPAGRELKVRWTNVLENLVRPGDANPNSSVELSLRPGETWRLTAEFYDEGQPLRLAGEPTLPPGVSVSFTSQRDASNQATNLIADLVFTASQADAGTLQRFIIPVVGEQATTAPSWTVYVPTAAEQRVVLTEFLANPTAKVTSLHFNPLNRAVWPPEDPVLAGRLTTLDEYVELVNFGPETVDLGGWTLSDATRLRAGFAVGDPNCRVASAHAIVVYGGPADGAPPRLSSPAIPVTTPPGTSATSEGLSLNNTSDVIVVRNAAGHLVERIVYGPSQLSASGSLTRWPEETGSFAAHAVVDPARPVSPGLPADGHSWATSPSAGALKVAAGVEAGRIVLKWPAIAEATYSVLRAPTLAGPWTRVVTGLREPGYSELPAANENPVFQITSP